MAPRASQYQYYFYASAASTAFFIYNVAQILQQETSEVQPSVAAQTDATVDQVTLQSADYRTSLNQVFSTPMPSEHTSPPQLITPQSTSPRSPTLKSTSMQVPVHQWYSGNQSTATMHRIPASSQPRISHVTPALTKDECNTSEAPAGTVTVHGWGRLGNLMSQYASLWALAKNVSLPRVALFPKMRKRLLQVFSKLSINETRLCPKQLPLVNIENFFNNQKGSITKVENQGVMLHGYPEEVYLFNQYQNDVRKEFQFRSDLADQAQAVLRNITHNGTFVGVHIRRTDYAYHIKWQSKGKLIGISYFHRAMELMRQKLFEPVFVVTSDDEKWATKHVVNESTATYWVGHSGNSNLDFAILSACNHSIISLGTFGFWTAYLAGGITILPDNFSEKPYPLYEKVKQANISRWIFLDISKLK